MLKKVSHIILIFLLFPFWILMKHDKNFNLIGQDMLEWSHRRELNQKSPTLYLFILLLTLDKSFRNVLYFRLAWKSRFISFIFRPLDSLYISTPKDKVAGGLFICHGFSTIISAKSIGSNCWINQQVTIGYTSKTDCPIIGNDVYVHAGAIVIGAITLGDNSVIGAGAVVTKNVPANCYVVGNPARIIRKNGLKVNEKL